MNKLAKGAFTMVLVGAVTFTAANFLLADHSFNQSKKENTASNFKVHKTSNDTNQADKTLKNPIQKTADDVNPKDNAVKDQPTATETKQKQSTISNNNSALQDVSYNEIDRNKPVTVIQNKTTASNSVTATMTPNTAAPATHPTLNSNPDSISTTNTKSAVLAAPTTPTSASAPAAPTRKTANHGHQVSQAAKAKALSHQNIKVNNGKKNL